MILETNSSTEIPNVKPDVFDSWVYTIRSRYISVTFDKSVEANVNVFSQRRKNDWEPPIFIYNTMIDLIAVFVYFNT